MAYRINDFLKRKTTLLKFCKLYLISVPLFCFSTQIQAQDIDQGVPTGWAIVPADGVETTTGGGSAVPDTVTTYEELYAAVSDNHPRVIVVSDSISTLAGGSGYAMKIASNKTIIGIDKDAKIYGGLEVNGESNVIIRNLSIHGVWPNSGPDDAMALHHANHVWLDHLNIWDAGDGILDITNQSEYVTVSWCKFWYTNPSHPHRLACLIGSGGGDHPEDWDHLKVTYHHCWYDKLVDQRMPRVMYGQVHVFNDYYTCSGNNYCIGVGSYGAALIENNYFKSVNDPHAFMYDIYCWISASGNIYDHTTGKKDNGKGGSRDVDVAGYAFPVQPFDNPPYLYTLGKAENIPDIVANGAGPHDEYSGWGLMPAPGQGAVDVNLKPSLQWTEKQTASSYMVSFGTTNPPPLVTTTSELSYSPDSLDEGTVYYWKVDPVTSTDTLEGKVWRFRTAGTVAGYPFVAITSPDSTDEFDAPADIPIETNVYDSVGTITSVEFYAGSTHIGSADSLPYSMTWKNVGAGTHEIYAKIIDDLGYKYTSDTIKFNVNTVIPTVTITSPNYGQSFQAPVNITLAADASDEDGWVTSVEFFNDTISLGMVTSPPYTLIWNDVSPGAYYISARVTDNDGRTFTSSKIFINVENGTGIKQEKSKITIYPNPVSEKLALTLDGFYHGTAFLTLYNSFGKALKEKTITGNPYILDVSDLPRGGYFVKLTSKSTTKTIKIIVQ